MSMIVDNRRDNATELWIDGKFVSSWHIISIPEPIRSRVEAMLREAIKVGEAKKAEEIRKALGVAK